MHRVLFMAAMAVLPGGLFVLAGLFLARAAAGRVGQGGSAWSPALVFGRWRRPRSR